MNSQAKKIVEKLQKEGFLAYYAGGWVRDYLLHHPSDDIDIATNAPPETVMALFPKTVPIGIQFGIVLVLMEGHEYEVATFREDLNYKDGRRPSQIAFSTPQEDAKRRDFTINGMFFDPVTNEILDFVGGKEDLKKKIIRAIGDPHKRIQEDRLRMIRAIRLSCRFSFPIEEKTKQAILDHANELFPAVAIERIMQELKKANAFSKLPQMLEILFEYGLLKPIFPELEKLSLQRAKEKLQPTKNYPKKAPASVFLYTLIEPQNIEAFSKRLKLSNQESEFLKYLRKFEENKKDTLVCWAHLYANPSVDDVLQILSEEHKIHLEEHQKRKIFLKKSIERIQKKDPVLKAEDLIQEGISPGKAMGDLLRLAEEISINHQIEDKNTLLKELKSSTLWHNRGR